MIEIRQGDALAVLREMPSDHFHCVVTSPPYWGLRDYGCDGQIGLEPTPDEWCARLVEVFREVRRVLRSDGVCFVNIGDSYCSGTTAERKPGNGDCASWTTRNQGPRTAATGDLKPKDLIGAPWMLAFALRADGWWLRSEIIWAKPNPMPESVRDRPTKAHEQVFLLTKASRYFWDAGAVREPHAPPNGGHRPGNGAHGQGHLGSTSHLDRHRDYNPAGRNLRSVWTIATDPLPSIIVDGEKLDHFASYPVELARRCILAGTSAKGCCPECGAPWARIVEHRDVNERNEQIATDSALSFAEGSGHEVGRSSDRVRKLNGKNYVHVRGGTLGWRPTCSCDRAYDLDVERYVTAPCRVLDCFGGSGRTALAAEELGRDCTLIELSEKSCAMAKAQLERAKARRMIGDAERVPVAAGQLGLFDA